MKIWFDADNAPHVLVMIPLAEKLISKGHQVKFTARDRAGTCKLLDLYGIEYISIGKEYPKSIFGKILGTLSRSVRLAYAMRKWKADISFGHGSRSLPIASFLLRIPSITMFDYEWVNPLIFNGFCSRILLPDAISEKRCREAKIRLDKAVFFPGYKEQLYLYKTAQKPDIAHELGLKKDKIKVLLRPPATNAHYHNPEAESILEALLKKLLANPGIQLIWIPRTSDQNSYVEGIKKAEVIIPSRQLPGPELILSMDLVIGGGGTMTREAAILGIRSVSFFRGKTGAVDNSLEKAGKLSFLESSSDVNNLKLDDRIGDREEPVVNQDLINKICDTIVGN